MIKAKDRLHYFLAKIAGKNPDTELIPRTQTEYWLDQIAQKPSGSDLPEVDSTDNGKVLTVVDGEWDAAGASSGLPEVSSADNGKALVVDNGEWAVENLEFGLVVDVTMDSSIHTQFQYRLSHSFDEIKAAVLSGKNVVLYYQATIYQIFSATNWPQSSSNTMTFYGPIKYSGVNHVLYDYFQLNQSNQNYASFSTNYLTEAEVISAQPYEENGSLFLPGQSLNIIWESIFNYASPKVLYLMIVSEVETEHGNTLHYGDIFNVVKLWETEQYVEDYGGYYQTVRHVLFNAVMNINNVLKLVSYQADEVMETGNYALTRTETAL